MSQVTLTLDFGTPSLIEIPFSFGGVDYVLVEPSGGAKAEVQNALIKCAKLVDGKPTSAEGVGDIDPLLVSKCLFTVKDGKRSSVSQEYVRNSLPARVVNELGAKARMMAGLSDPDTIEGLRNQIEVATKKLAVLEAGESVAKN